MGLVVARSHIALPVLEVFSGYCFQEGSANKLPEEAVMEALAGFHPGSEVISSLWICLERASG